jgi:hypothetical protein
VVLIAMPWSWLRGPSIQLGILQSVLEQAGIRAEVCSLYLAFMEHLAACTAGRDEGEPLTTEHYAEVAEVHHTVGMGDWIFAVPPFRETGERDEAYLGDLRVRKVPEPAIERAGRMRALVPAYLERCAGEILAARPAVVGFTTSYSQNVPSLVLAKILKERDPSLRIVFGGANCDGPMGDALHRAFPWVDVVVRGEGERVLPELARDLLAGEPVRPQPGLCYWEGDQHRVIEQTHGDVLMQEGNGTFDVLRFPGDSSLRSYSDNTDGADALADTGFPTAFFANQAFIPELGPEGNNRATYTPVAGQPGFDASNPTYVFVSDGVAQAAPEPSTHPPSALGAPARGPGDRGSGAGATLAGASDPGSEPGPPSLWPPVNPVRPG